MSLISYGAGWFWRSLEFSCLLIGNSIWNNHHRNVAQLVLPENLFNSDSQTDVDNVIPPRAAYIDQSRRNFNYRLFGALWSISPSARCLLGIKTNEAVERAASLFARVDATWPVVFVCVWGCVTGGISPINLTGYYAYRRRTTMPVWHRHSHIYLCTTERPPHFLALTETKRHGISNWTRCYTYLLPPTYRSRSHHISLKSIIT